MTNYIDRHTFYVGNFLLIWDIENDAVKFTVFDDPDNYYGITFTHGKWKTEVIECKLGTRILIMGDIGECRDIPFHEGTWHLLPKGVKAERTST